MLIVIGFARSGRKTGRSRCDLHIVIDFAPIHKNPPRALPLLGGLCPWIDRRRLFLHAPHNQDTQSLNMHVKRPKAAYEKLIERAQGL
jgi:hypothetical protein